MICAGAGIVMLLFNLMFNKKKIVKKDKKEMK